MNDTIAGVLAWLGWWWAGWWLSALLLAPVWPTAGYTPAGIFIGLLFGHLVMRPLYHKVHREPTLPLPPMVRPIDKPQDQVTTDRDKFL